MQKHHIYFDAYQHVLANELRELEIVGGMFKLETLSSSPVPVSLIRFGYDEDGQVFEKQVLHLQAVCEWDLRLETDADVIRIGPTSAGFSYFTEISGKVSRFHETLDPVSMVAAEMDAFTAKADPRLALALRQIQQLGGQVASLQGKTVEQLSSEDYYDDEEEPGHYLYQSEEEDASFSDNLTAPDAGANVGAGASATAPVLPPGAGAGAVADPDN